MASTDEDFQQLTESIANSEGDAEEMAKTMLNNLQGDITILNSAMEGLKIIVSDSFKEQLRSFVQSFTEEIGKLNEAFQENGVLGMFVNIADWVINGLVDQLSNPSEEQVKNFGKGIGEFIGSVAAKLITSLPDLLAGIVTIGESLAGGLFEGLFKGLFGEKTGVAKLVESMEKELNGIEVNSVRAQGLLSYLEELAQTGDENVTKTEAWQTAVEQLEEIMPGVKAILEDEGATLDENIQKVRNMTDEFRKQAIQQAMVNTLQKQYELLAEQGVTREREQINYDVAKDTQKAVGDTLRENIGRYAQYISEGMASGAFVESAGMSELIGDLLQGRYWEGDQYSNIGDLSQDALMAIMHDLTGYVENLSGEKIWDTDQNYLSPEEIESLNQQYVQAGQDMEAATQKISEINGEMDATKAEIATTEKAVQSVTNELTGTAAGVGTAGSSVVSSLNSLAGRIDSVTIGGGSDGSNAKGLWDVPYDDYVSTLHRGEMVLNASRAREYREGGVNTGIDLEGLRTAVETGIKAGMENAKVRSYLNGRDITDEVNRRQIKQLKARRYNG